MEKFHYRADTNISNIDTVRNEIFHLGEKVDGWALSFSSGGYETPSRLDVYVLYQDASSENTFGYSCISFTPPFVHLPGFLDLEL